MRLRIAATLAAATALLAAPAHAAPLGHAGRWLTDAQGRVVVLHGVNVSDKSPPFAPDLSDADIAALADDGMNVVRIGVEWEGLEPQPGVYDDAYVQRIATFARRLAAQGISPLIDFHQDQYGPVTDGNGIPPWATFTDGFPDQPECGFGCDYLVRPDVQRAYDNFWLDHAAPDGIGIQEHFAAAAAHLAGALRGVDDLLGYEFINEMWPGSQYGSCIPAGCPAFDKLLLDPFNAKVAAALSAADPGRLIFAEPHTLFNEGVRSYTAPVPVSGDGFAFHVYCELGSADATAEKPGGAQVCPVQEQLAVDNAVQRVGSSGEALLMTEFGATPVDRPVRHITELADQDMIPWIWWEAREYYAQDRSLLVRAYPQAIAGTPTSWAFDPAARTFTLTYSTAAAGAALRPGADTVVYVPRLQYPNGYTATATGAAVTSEPGAQRLVLRTAAGASSVSLTVRPR